jgi:hypothetical protein
MPGWSPSRLAPPNGDRATIFFTAFCIFLASFLLLSGTGFFVTLEN